MIFSSCRPNRSWICKQLVSSQAAVPFRPQKQRSVSLRCTGWKVYFGDYSVGSTGFPPFNQVTQAWNAQLCQIQHVADAWEITAYPGYWCEERPQFPSSVLWMAALTSQQLGITEGTNNKAQAKRASLCCSGRAILIYFWYLLWLQSVRGSTDKCLECKHKGSLCADKIDLWPVLIAFKILDQWQFLN